MCETTLTAHPEVPRFSHRMSQQILTVPYGLPCGFPVSWNADSRSGLNRIPCSCWPAKALQLPAPCITRLNMQVFQRQFHLPAFFVLVKTYFYSYWIRVGTLCSHSAPTILYTLSLYPHLVPDGLPCVTAHRILSTLARSFQNDVPKVMAYFPCAVSDTDDHFIFKVHDKQNICFVCLSQRTIRYPLWKTDNDRTAAVSAAALSNAAILVQTFQGPRA